MKTNALTLIITLVVGVILAGSLLAPVISDAQKTLGDPVTLENTPRADNFDYAKWDGSAISFAYSGSNHAATEMSDEYTINNESSGLNFVSAVQRIIIASDAFCVRVGGGSPSAVTLDVQWIGGTAGVQGKSFSFDVAANGDYTLTVGLDTPLELTGTINWLIYATPEGNLNLLQLNDTSVPFYTGLKDDVIVLGNIYTTGDNDTFYAYYNGELTVNEDYADVSSVTLTKTLADGYTDIYDTTIAVNVGDETFTPFFILAPKTVTGHEASGASYSLLGAIPIMVIVAILMLAVGAIAYRRAD